MRAFCLKFYHSFRDDWEEKFDKLFSEEDLKDLKNIKNKFDDEEWT